MVKCQPILFLVYLPVPDKEYIVLCATSLDECPHMGVMVRFSTYSLEHLLVYHKAECVHQLVIYNVCYVIHQFFHKLL